VPDALSRLSVTIGEALVLAHYAPFDIGVIRDACAETAPSSTSPARGNWPGLPGPGSVPTACPMWQLPRSSNSARITMPKLTPGLRQGRRSGAQLPGCDWVPKVLTEISVYPGTLQGGIYTRSTRPEDHQAPSGPNVWHDLRPLPPLLRADPGLHRRNAVEDPPHGAAGSSQRGRTPNDLGWQEGQLRSSRWEFHGLLAWHAFGHRLEQALELKAAGQDLELLNQVEFLTPLRGGS
jgi:hypothetical protein